MLPLKKIYIDSRDRTADSKSSSNFKIELPYTVEMPDNTVFFVTDVCIPNVWQTIKTDFNDRLYLVQRGPDTMQDGYILHNNMSYKIIKLSQGNYNIISLSNEIQTKLRASVDSFMNAGVSFNVTYDTTTNSITITLTGNTSNCSFRLLTDAEVRSGIRPYSWQGDTVDVNHPRSANDVLKLVNPMLPTTSWTTVRARNKMAYFPRQPLVILKKHNFFVEEKIESPKSAPRVILNFRHRLHNNFFDFLKSFFLFIKLLF